MQKNLSKRIIVCLIILALTLISLGTISYAASFSVSAGNTLDIGKTTSLTINATGCLGQFTIKSSDSSVVSVSESSKWIENTSASITLTAKKAGTATITVTAADVSDLAGDNEITGSKTVKITVPEQKQPEQNPPANNNSGSSNNNNADTRSSDATLKSITVGGKTYSKPNTDITVSNVSANTSSIEIKADTNHSKAKVSGTGTKELVTGTNKFTLKVTAENGQTKSYIVRITRLAEESTTPNVVDDNPPPAEVKQEEPVVEEQKLRLVSLEIEGVELIPAFDSETFEYSVFITEQEEVKINAVANIEDAVIEITGNTGLIDGENTAIIKITKDDKITEYKIFINKTGITSVVENVEEMKDKQEEKEEQKTFIGMISDWWNRSGPMTLMFTVTLVLLGASIVFAVISYKYSNNVRSLARHSKVDFVSNEELINQDNDRQE